MDAIEFLMLSQNKTREEATALWEKYNKEDPKLASMISRAAGWKADDDLRSMANMYGDLLFKPMSMKDRLAPGPQPLPIGNTLKSLAYPPIAPPQPKPAIINWQNLGHARPIPTSPGGSYYPSSTGGGETADLGGQ